MSAGTIAGSRVCSVGVGAAMTHSHVHVGLCAHKAINEIRDKVFVFVSYPALVYLVL